MANFILCCILRLIALNFTAASNVKYHMTFGCSYKYKKMPINIFVDWNTFINVVDQTLPKVSDELLRDLQVLVDRLASKASRLIKNFTTNIAENWMNVRCKFDGGKYVNRSQSGSFQFRCYGAGLQQNLGKSWSPAIWGQMVGSTPNQVFLDAAEASTKKAEKTRKRMATQKSKESRKKIQVCQA